MSNLKRYEPAINCERGSADEVDDGEYVKYNDVGHWVAVTDELPELEEQSYGWRQSSHYPVMVEGLKYWCEAYLYQSLDTTFTEWKLSGFGAGNRKVTHWYKLPLLEV